MKFVEHKDDSDALGTIPKDLIKRLENLEIREPSENI